MEKTRPTTEPDDSVTEPVVQRVRSPNRPEERARSGPESVRFAVPTASNQPPVDSDEDSATQPVVRRESSPPPLSLSELGFTAPTDPEGNEALLIGPAVDITQSFDRTATEPVVMRTREPERSSGEIRWGVQEEAKNARDSALEKRIQVLRSSLARQVAAQTPRLVSYERAEEQSQAQDQELAREAETELAREAETSELHVERLRDAEQSTGRLTSLGPKGWREMYENRDTESEDIEVEPVGGCEWMSTETEEIEIQDTEGLCFYDELTGEWEVDPDALPTSPDEVVELDELEQTTTIQARWSSPIVLVRDLLAGLAIGGLSWFLAVGIPQGLPYSSAAVAPAVTTPAIEVAPPEADSLLSGAPAATASPDPDSSEASDELLSPEPVQEPLIAPSSAEGSAEPVTAAAVPAAESVQAPPVQSGSDADSDVSSSGPSKSIGEQLDSALGKADSVVSGVASAEMALARADARILLEPDLLDYSGNVEQAERALRARRAQMQKEYQVALGRTPDLAGELELAWMVKNGRASEIMVISDSIGDDDLIQSILGQAERWRFPPNARGDASVVLTFEP